MLVIYKKMILIYVKYTYFMYNFKAMTKIYGNKI
jgi:hypothetical protein